MKELCKSVCILAKGPENAVILSDSALSKQLASHTNRRLGNVYVMHYARALHDVAGHVGANIR